MIVTKKLKVNNGDYFDCLTRYLIKELRKSVDKGIKAKDIKPGYRFDRMYKTKNGEFKSIQVIEEFDYGKAYKLKIKLPQGYQIISHHIKELSDDEIEVRYEEVVETSKLSLKIQQFMRRGKSKKLMTRLLHDLEAEITLK